MANQLYTWGHITRQQARTPVRFSADEFTKKQISGQCKEILLLMPENQSLAYWCQEDQSIPKVINPPLFSGYFYRYRDFTGRLPFMNGGWVDLNRHFGGFSKYI
jgi:hypothetical protein